GAKTAGRRRLNDRPSCETGVSGQTLRAEGRRMNILSFFRKRGTAPVARERLQILLAHERKAQGHSDLLNILREEILAVVARHISLEPDKVQVRMDRGDPVSTLEVDIEIPNQFDLLVSGAA